MGLGGVNLRHEGCVVRGDLAGVPASPEGRLSAVLHEASVVGLNLGKTAEDGLNTPELALKEGRVFPSGAFELNNECGLGCLECAIQPADVVVAQGEDVVANESVGGEEDGKVDARPAHGLDEWCKVTLGCNGLGGGCAPRDNKRLGRFAAHDVEPFVGGFPVAWVRHRLIS